MPEMPVLAPAEPERPIFHVHGPIDSQETLDLSPSSPVGAAGQKDEVGALLLDRNRLARARREQGNTGRFACRRFELPELAPRRTHSDFCSEPGKCRERLVAGSPQTDDPAELEAGKKEAPARTAVTGHVAARRPLLERSPGPLRPGLPRFSRP